MAAEELAGIVDVAPDGIYINVHAQPGARRVGVCGIHGDAIKVAVREAAQDGRANAAVLNVLAQGLGLPRSAVCLTAGRSSRRKRLFAEGDPECLLNALREMLDG